eukprot:3495184-Lingulodinium_polyedra.AAC.1
MINAARAALGNAVEGPFWQSARDGHGSVRHGGCECRHGDALPARCAGRGAIGHGGATIPGGRGH